MSTHIGMSSGMNRWWIMPIKTTTYINFLEVADEIGINYETDTSDAGLHLNLSGAEKFTSYWPYPSEDFALENRKDDKACKHLE